MSKIRVLIVDDAVVVRQLVSRAVSAEADLEVVGTAPDGRTALDRLATLRPDVILLDLEMPGMDGLQTLTAVRQLDPRVAVIMFSRHTQRGVEATVNALMLGANDYVPKPGDGLDVAACVRDLLIPKIRLHGARHARTRSAECGTRNEEGGAAAASFRTPHSAFPIPGRVEVVAIGCSTGGPNALVEVLPALPADWAVPTLIVQHMPAEFTARLAERLAARSGLDVREARAGQLLTAAQVWVAPGDHHLVVERAGRGRRVALHQGPPVQSCRPSVDVLFGSAAECFGPGVLAVVLTGMGQDGLDGCRRVRHAGGQVLVQDEATSVVWSMPGCVAGAGLADQVLPLGHVGPEIVRRAGAG